MTAVAGGSRTAALLERVESLEGAVSSGGPRLPAPVVAGVGAALGGVRRRLALGVDHTVVALVGGTGSGKSSLFNALVGLPVSDVGVRRPTTSQATACVWSHDATALLDWLGVAEDRRVTRETALDGETQADLRGLVLLDLPDLDSVEPEHRAVVDRLLPQADLLVWVVDPQKYADDALHTGYLRHLAGHEGAMLVVLNQVDTLPPGAEEGLVRDLRRLLVEDGLTDVPVQTVSAQRGDGVPDLRSALVRAVGGRHLAETRATAEVEGAAALLATALGAGEAEDEEERSRAAVSEVADAVGLPGVVAAVARTSRRAGATTDPHVGPVPIDRVGRVRARWVDRAAAGLPPLWREALDRALPGTDRLAREVDAAVQGIAPPRSRASGAAVAVAAAVVLVLVAAGAAAVAGSTVTSSGWGPPAQLWTAVAVGGLVLALVLARVGRAMRRAAARRRAQHLQTAVTSALDGVVREHLARPTAAVLGDHRAVRVACRAAARPARSTSPAAARRSTG